MAKRRQRTTCTFCYKEVEHATVEHVFPRSWYPASTPSTTQYRTVPSCLACNHEFGRIEERVRLDMAFCIDTANPDAKGVWEQTFRSLLPDTARTPKERKVRRRNALKFRARMTAVPVGTPSRPFPGTGRNRAGLVQTDAGIWTTGHMALPVNISDLTKMVEKFVRGFFLLETGRLLLPATAIEAHFAPEASWPDLLKTADAAGLQVGGVPPGLRYRFRVVDDHPECSLWLFLVWGQLMFQAGTGVNELRAAGPDANAGRDS